MSRRPAVLAFGALTTTVTLTASLLAGCSADQPESVVPAPAEPSASSVPSAPSTASPSAPSAGAQAPSPGADGAGDPYYPKDGNGGYDALDYHVGIGFDPASGQLNGDTVITARATQSLSRFNLDLRGLTVNSVQVDGAAATASRQGEFELVITPARPVPAGATFATRVRYSGKPVTAQDGQLGANGWARSSSGGAYVVGEPHSAAFWYPVNETPRDKATFHLSAQVPTGWQVISNGLPEGSSTDGGRTTFRWNEPKPIASYLTTMAVDRFTLNQGTLPGGVPVLDAYAPGAQDMRGVGSRLPEVLGFLAGKFGAYPQSAAGGIYLNEQIGFSLETQTRPTYAKGIDLETVVHENAHQWFGDQVSVRSWADICLNECLASYAQWLWAETKEGSKLDERFHRAVEKYKSSKQFWGRKLYDMGAGNEFTGVYSKGILAMHALRRKMGEPAFAKLLVQWPAAHSGGNASWPEFERFAAGLAGQDLGRFFQVWFHGTTMPTGADLNPGSLGG